MERILHFTEQAKIARRQKQAIQDKTKSDAEQERAKRVLEEFERTFGYTPDFHWHEGVEIDGVGLHYRELHSQAEWRVWGTCPECEERCLSSVVWDFASVGEQLEAFRPDYDHVCETSSADEEEDTISQILASYYDDSLFDEDAKIRLLAEIARSLRSAANELRSINAFR